MEPNGARETTAIQKEEEEAKRRRRAKRKATNDGERSETRSGGSRKKKKERAGRENIKDIAWNVMQRVRADRNDGGRRRGRGKEDRERCSEAT